MTIGAETGRASGGAIGVAGRKMAVPSRVGVYRGCLCSESRTRNQNATVAPPMIPAVIPSALIRTRRGAALRRGESFIAPRKSLYGGRSHDAALTAFQPIRHLSGGLAL